MKYHKIIIVFVYFLRSYNTVKPVLRGHI